MLAFLQGKVLKKADKGIILLTGQIGYFVHLSKQLIITLAEGADAEFFLYHNIKEDASDLYGFNTYLDLEFFTKLISVNGIGPKVALEILNTPQEQVKTAIISEDEAFICKIPGIGKKTSKRLIMELMDKIEFDGSEGVSLSQTLDQRHHDAIEALTRLGYQRNDISNQLKELPKDLIKAEEIITYFLKNN